jgi:hypothetical protein
MAMRVAVNGARVRHSGRRWPKCRFHPLERIALARMPIHEVISDFGSRLPIEVSEPGRASSAR